ncbi:hypothetical protein [Rubinisphaera sp.]|uniref:hypothetical protein n=1 Tax=Rubinisphaera sp. TaxID=2024857 RepID=UPI000C11C163|nr:hypothetical protein [Rubinisphaera sp.]MBV09614.1 hypothetical protein [Rubinisphaera sp.]HCS53431.1 hypothetical protein [Planctomycetaceae bacterium]|tara:strand:- start:1411 stop:1845 length:435 start_codon:yes stop_codon:yes gene_type:complete
MRVVCQTSFLSIPRIVLICGLVAVIGCGGSGAPIPKLAPVTGKVEFQGKPLEGASVSFSPEQAAETGSQRTSIGRTDENGVFTLMYNGDYEGAIIGTHIVRISKLEGTDEEPGGEMLQAKYNVQSTLTETVSADGLNDFFFELK